MLATELALARLFFQKPGILKYFKLKLLDVKYTSAILGYF